jgi:hypothetical protein
MKRLTWLLPAMIIFSISNVRAQETPRVEISGGYSYLDSSLSGTNGTHIHLNGGGISATENLNRWFGGRIEVNGYVGNETVLVSGVPTTKSVTAETLTYGPVFSYRRSSRIIPFGHVQVGVVHGGIYYQDISAPAYKFALAPGGGFDVNLNRKTTFRFDGEYLMTRFVNQWQRNVVGSVGIVLRFGHR